MIGKYYSSWKEGVEYSPVTKVKDMSSEKQIETAEEYVKALREIMRDAKWKEY